MAPIDLPETDSHPPPEFHPLLSRLLILNWINILLSIIYFFYMMRVLGPNTPPEFELSQTQYNMLVGWCVLLFGLGGYAVGMCVVVVLRGSGTERLVAAFFTLLSLPGLILSPMALVHVLTL